MARLGPAPQVAALAPCPKVPTEAQRQLPLRQRASWSGPDPASRASHSSSQPLSAPAPGCLLPRAHREEGRPDARPLRVQARRQKASMGLESLGTQDQPGPAGGLPWESESEDVEKGAKGGSFSMVPEDWGLQWVDALQAARPQVPLNVGIQWDSWQGRGDHGNVCVSKSVVCVYKANVCPCLCVCVSGACVGLCFWAYWGCGCVCVRRCHLLVTPNRSPAEMEPGWGMGMG